METHIEYTQPYRASSTREEWQEELARNTIYKKLCDFDVDQLQTEEGRKSFFNTLSDCVNIIRTHNIGETPRAHLFLIIKLFNHRRFQHLIVQLQRMSAYQRNENIHKIEALRTNLFFFSMPKSGTTYVLNFLHAYFGLNGDDLSYHNILTLPAMNINYEYFNKTSLKKETIFHSHAPFDPLISYILKKNRHIPLILVRDIFEAIESMVDYHNDSLICDLRNNLDRNKSYDRKRGQSYVFKEDREINLTNGISKYACDFIDFYAQWVRAQSVLGNPILSYDFLKMQPKLFFSQLINFCKSPADLGKIQSILDDFTVKEKTDSKFFNITKKGKGRGIKNFTEVQIQTVRSIYRLYPDVNFSLIDKDLLSSKYL